MFSVPGTVAHVFETLVDAKKTKVHKPETFFRLTRKIVSMAGRIFWLAQTEVSGIEKMVCVTQNIFSTTGTRVTAPQKMLSVAATMV